MGLRYRKSIKLGGGFRINISKSGIGYSWGVPGYRITKTASGKTRTTVSIPGTGISYVSETSKKNRNKSNKKDTIQYTDITAIQSGNIKDLQPAEFKDLISKIQLILNLNETFTVLFWVFLVLYIGYSTILSGTLLLITAGIKFLLRFCASINLDYNFYDNSPQCIEAQNNTESWKILKNSKQIWYIKHIGKTSSSRNSGGADSAYDREPTQITFRPPYYLRSNIELPVIKMKKEKEMLIILPDCILLIRRNKVGAVKYEDAKIDIYAIGEIAKNSPASDCKFSKNVWLYTNKDGSPDMRHKDNKQLPVYEIGRIDISSPNGLDIRLAISNTDVLEEFKSKCTYAKMC